MKNEQIIFEETNQLDEKLSKMYEIYARNKKIIVPQYEFLEFHDEIIDKENAIALTNYDIILARNIEKNFNKKYYDVLKNDLNNLIDLVLKYIEPIVNSINTAISNYDFRELRYRSYENKLFDSDVLNNKYDFDNYFGTLLRKNGLLDELYYLLPEELRKEELTTLLYKKLSIHGLAISYYVNNLYENNDEIFYGNNKTDQIFVELKNRSTEEIIIFLKDIIKIPCSYVMGVVSAFIYLSNKYPHDYLTDSIYNLPLQSDFKNIDKEDIDILYGCLKTAEKVKLQIENDGKFDTYNKSLKYYVSNYERKKLR